MRKKEYSPIEMYLKEGVLTPELYNVAQRLKDDWQLAGLGAPFAVKISRIRYSEEVSVNDIIAANKRIEAIKNSLERSEWDVIEWIVLRIRGYRCMYFYRDHAPETAQILAQSLKNVCHHYDMYDCRV